MIQKNSSIDWQSTINRNVQSLKPSGIRAFFDIINSRKDCISLGVGEPDFISPQPILEAAITSIQKGYTHYTANQGLLSLRKKISEYLQKEYNLSYNPETEIIVTVGVSQGLDLAIRSIMENGDGGLFSSPAYVSYSALIELVGGIAQPFSVYEKNKFQIQAKDIETAITPKSKFLLLGYPGNPTGASLNYEQLSNISKVVIENNLLVISDEIYGELSYDQKHIPLATLPNMKERVMTLGGFSKAFAMTGWRVGYACGPEEWIKSMFKIHQYSMLCTPTVSQIAAEAALSFSLQDRDKMKNEYNERRNIIVSRFNNMGLKCINPDGAFYAFPSIQSSNMTSLEFATKLLEDQNVAVVPGSAFGKEGEGFIRCSYATSKKEIIEAMNRIEKFITKIK